MASSTFRIGDRLVGIRSSSVRVDALLRDVLQPHLVSDVVAPDTYSLRLELDPPPRHIRPLSLLFEGGSCVARSRSAWRVADSLLAHLDAQLQHERSDLVKVRGLAFIADGRAVVAPGWLRPHLARISPRLTAAGSRIMDGPWVSIDGDGMVVVPQRHLQVVAGPIEDLAGSAALGAPDHPVEAGRYPVRGWLVTGAGSPSEVHSTTGVLQGFAERVDPTPDAQAALDALAAACGDARVTSCPFEVWGAVEAILDLLPRRSQGGGRAR